MCVCVCDRLGCACGTAGERTRAVVTNRGTNSESANAFRDQAFPAGRHGGRPHYMARSVCGDSVREGGLTSSRLRFARSLAWTAAAICSCFVLELLNMLIALLVILFERRPTFEEEEDEEEEDEEGGEEEDDDDELVVAGADAPLLSLPMLPPPPSSPVRSGPLDFAFAFAVAVAVASFCCARIATLMCDM